MQSKITISRATPEGTVTTELVTDNMDELNEILSLAGMIPREQYIAQMAPEVEEPEMEPEIEMGENPPEEDFIPEEEELDLYGIPAARPKVRYTGNYGDNALGESKEVDEANYSAKKAAAGKDIGKKGKNFSKIADTAAKKYGSKEAGERVAGAVLKKLRAHESQDIVEAYEQLDEVSKDKLASYILKSKMGKDSEKRRPGIKTAVQKIHGKTTVPATEEIVDEREDPYSKNRSLDFKGKTYNLNQYKDGMAFLPTEEMQSIGDLPNNQYFGKELKTGDNISIFGVEMQNRDGTIRKTWYSSYGGTDADLNKVQIFYHDQNPSNIRAGMCVFRLTPKDFATPEAIENAKRIMTAHGWKPNRKYSVRVAK